MRRDLLVQRMDEATPFLAWMDGRDLSGAELLGSLNHCVSTPPVPRVNVPTDWVSLSKSNETFPQSLFLQNCRYPKSERITTVEGENPMEKLDLSKLKLAGERLKTSGAQMGRTISSKMKEILQAPTTESKVIDEATSERMEEPNWGLNLRICAMISREEYDGAEIVKAIKKKLVPGKNPAVQCLSLDLLEACTSNCEKVFSEVASEKVLEDMVRLIEDPRTDDGVRVRAMQLIRAWGESEDLEYLPAFHQTYMLIKAKEIPPPPQDGGLPSAPAPQNMESYLGQEQISPPGRYPIPNTGPENNEDTTFIGYGYQSIEEKKEVLVVARNSLDILSSILISDAEPKRLQDDLTVSMLEKCKQSLPAVQKIIESISDDEGMLFDALNLHDELQAVISRHSELVAALESGRPKSHNVGEDSSDTNTTGDASSELTGGHSTTAKLPEIGQH